MSDFKRVGSAVATLLQVDPVAAGRAAVGLSRSVMLADFARINEALLAAYQRHRAAESYRKSHFFGGRYENIYIDRERLPEVQPVLDFACAEVGAMVGVPAAALSVGFWFNEMLPGHTTLLHNHNDDDELMSGVYYVRVPDDSGDLLLHHGKSPSVIRPLDGRCVFFGSDVDHEVLEHKGEGVRLSIGMNFGIRRADAA